MMPSDTRVLLQAAELEPGKPRMDALLEQLSEQEGLDRLIRFAVKEGLAGFLYQDLKRSGGLQMLTPQAVQGLRRLYEQTVHFNLRLMHDFKEVLRRFNHEGTRVVLLQGMALLQQIYPGSIGLRPMTDVDLWVRPHEYGFVADLLREFGYQRDRTYPNTFSKGATTFDLHSHLIWADRIRARRHILHGGQDAVCHEAVPIDFEGEEVLVLSPLDQVLYLSLHAFKHNLDRLIWLVDIKFLLQRFDSRDWEALVHRASSLGLKRHLGYALFLIRHLFHLDPPSEVRPLLGDRSPGTIVRRLLRRRVAGGRLPGWGPLLLLLPETGIAKKVSYLLEASFPRREVLRQVFVENPELKTWQLYWMRAVQMFGKIRLAMRGL
jgi:hypothetical protein